MPKKILVSKWDIYWKLKIHKEVPWKTYRTFLCECSCWNVAEVLLCNIRSWKTSSCWCNYTTHWMRNTRIYQIWNTMKTRCNSNIKAYSKITYDKKWESFQWFYKDMKEWYSDELTIDRIDNHWNYCKNNCRWATWKQQARNKSNNLLYKWKTIAEWCEDLWINRQEFDNKYYKWKTIEQSLWI